MSVPSAETSTGRRRWSASRRRPSALSGTGTARTEPAPRVTCSAPTSTVRVVIRGGRARRGVFAAGRAGAALRAATPTTRPLRSVSTTLSSSETEQAPAARGEQRSTTRTAALRAAATNEEVTTAPGAPSTGIASKPLAWLTLPVGVVPVTTHCR